MAIETPIDVACLVLRADDGRVLATRRPPDKSLGGLWEFPGGKIDAGETPESALRRELREELELQVGPLLAMEPVEHRYPFGTIRLWPLLANCDGSAKPGIVLHEHTDARWVDAQEADGLEWAPADVPVLAAVFSRA